MNQKATLVTPVFNALPYLKEYLDSVLKQSWRPLQFIAVDDGSTDGSLKYLYAMSQKLMMAGIETVILSQSHAGQAAAVNTALPLIEGEFFTWCDADDYLFPESIEKKVLYLLEKPELGMVRSDGLIVFLENGKMRRAARRKDSAVQNLFDAFFYQTTYVFGAGAYMVRTKLLFQCYPNKQIPLSSEGQNLQLLLPPASRTDCGFIPEILFFYHVHSGSHSERKRSFTQQKERMENFAKLRKEILQFCDCDRERYMYENEKILQENKRALLYSVVRRVRKDMDI